MKKEYDLSKMKARKNPYASRSKKTVTMRLIEDVIGYFKTMAEEVGVPYQSLINLYLRDCVATHRKLDMSWHSEFHCRRQIYFFLATAAICASVNV